MQRQRIMDAASEHAERLGIGTQFHRNGLFWLTVKTFGLLCPRGTAAVARAEKRKTEDAHAR